MNPFDGLGQGREAEAVIDYRDADFVVIRPGSFVRCAVTGAKISLEALRYWNVDKQEPYATAEAAMQGFGYKSKS